MRGPNTYNAPMGGGAHRGKGGPHHWEAPETCLNGSSGAFFSNNRQWLFFSCPSPLLCFFELLLHTKKKNIQTVINVGFIGNISVRGVAAVCLYVSASRCSGCSCVCSHVCCPNTHDHIQPGGTTVNVCLTVNVN